MLAIVLLKRLRMKRIVIMSNRIHINVREMNKVNSDLSINHGILQIETNAKRETNGNNE